MINKITFLILATGIFFAGCDNSSTTSEKDKSNTSKMTDMGNDNMDKKMKDDELKKKDFQMMNSMNMMMDKMKAMKMSGDFDKDFANMMIEHHQSAIDMSEEELKTGKDEKLKTMAQKIITDQKNEQNKLKDILKNLKPMNMDMGKHDELSKAMNEMQDNMKGMEMTGNADKDYAMMMIPHHASAIKMFTAEISHGMNPELKQIAKQGIIDQTKEISEFKSSFSMNK